jgi:hypothetical protein
MTRTKKQLETILLAKAVKKFGKTKLEKIGVRKVDNDKYKSEEYSIELVGFKFKLYLSKDLSKNTEDGHLWILDPQGYVFESFDLSDKNYESTLREMYNHVKSRITKYEEKQDRKKEIEFNRNLRRLDRIL